METYSGREKTLMMEAKINRFGTAVVDTFMQIMLERDVVQHAPFPQGAKIIAANHPGTADPFYMLPLLDEPIHILITEMAFKAPLFGHYLRAAGHIPVLRENGRAAFDTAVALLKQGETVGIFPEGALSPREGGLQRPRTGAARLALTAGVPLVPVGIALEPEHIHYVDTTFGGISETARWYLNGPYAMTIGSAIKLEGSTADRAYVRAASTLLLNRIGLLANESARRLQGQSFAIDTGMFPRPAELSAFIAYSRSRCSLLRFLFKHSPLDSLTRL